MRPSFVACAFAFLGCDPGAAPPLGTVEQATVADGLATAIVGQPDFDSMMAQPAAIDTVSAPSGLAVRQTGSGVLQVATADLLFHRVTIYDGRPTADGRLQGVGLVGQSDWGVDLSDRGLGRVTAAGLRGPQAVAWSPGNGDWLAVADTDNHRVLVGRVVPTWSPTVVLGQNGSFESGLPNDGGRSESTLDTPVGVAFGDAGEIYVADNQNHRVLIFEPGQTRAQRILGQIDFTRGLPNRGGSPSNESLSGPRGLAFERGGIVDQPAGIYVADTDNHRVLYFPAGSRFATRVYGQGGDFFRAVPSRNGVTAESLRAPTAVAVDGSGGIWVADSGHHRVLHFPIGSTVADRVIGQLSFTGGGLPSAPNAARLRTPLGVGFERGILFVADTGHRRLLAFSGCDRRTCDDGDPCTNDLCDASGACTHSAIPFPDQCRPYRCDAAARACRTECQIGGDCESPFLCIAGRCALPCASDDLCPGRRTCVDGFCCDRPCTGACEACDLPGRLGECSAVAAGSPRDECGDLTNECSPRCDGTSRECTSPPVGTSCGVERCEGDAVSSRGTCVEGACVGRSERSCAPYTCGSGRCLRDCRGDFDCAAGGRCVAGRCDPGDLLRSGGGDGCAVGGDPSMPFALLILLGLARHVGRSRRGS